MVPSGEFPYSAELKKVKCAIIVADLSEFAILTHSNYYSRSRSLKKVRHRIRDLPLSVFLAPADLKEEKPFTHVYDFDGLIAPNGVLSYRISHLRLQVLTRQVFQNLGELHRTR